MGFESSPHQPETCHAIKVAAIHKCRTALYRSVTAALRWFKHVSV